jgi:hypothetical protein
MSRLQIFNEFPIAIIDKNDELSIRKNSSNMGNDVTDFGDWN